VRIEENYELRAEHQAAFLALRPNGEWSSGALRSGFKVASMAGDADRIDHCCKVARHD
jgi:hypothetical protein